VVERGKRSGAEVMEVVDEGGVEGLPSCLRNQCVGLIIPAIVPAS